MNVVRITITTTAETYFTARHHADSYRLRKKQKEQPAASNTPEQHHRGPLAVYGRLLVFKPALTKQIEGES